MGIKLNLNDEQRQRIESAESPEEKAAIVAEAMGAERELSNEELDSVSGGIVIVPPTHEKINDAWDAIASILAVYGPEVAAISALEMNLISDEGLGGDLSTFGKTTLATCRQRMHDQLDGKNG